jgi:hypothetical protein
MRGIAALVAAVRLGARLGLLHGVDRDDAVADGELLLDRQIHQPARALAADIVVVRGLAADDAAEREEAVIALGGQRDRAGISKAPGTTTRSQVAPFWRTRLARRRSARRRSRVVARFDDQDARALTPSTGGERGIFVRVLIVDRATPVTHLLAVARLSAAEWRRPA